MYYPAEYICTLTDFDTPLEYGRRPTALFRGQDFKLRECGPVDPLVER